MLAFLPTRIVYTHAFFISVFINSFNNINYVVILSYWFDKTTFFHLQRLIHSLKTTTKWEGKTGIRWKYFERFLDVLLLLEDIRHKQNSGWAVAKMDAYINMTSVHFSMDTTRCLVSYFSLCGFFLKYKVFFSATLFEGRRGAFNNFLFQVWIDVHSYFINRLDWNGKVYIGVGATFRATWRGSLNCKIRYNQVI